MNYVCLRRARVVMLPMLVVCCSIALRGKTALAVSSHVGALQPTYPPGWSMVGGPAGSGFNAAALLEVYTPKGYEAMASRTVNPCEGFWAFFATASEAYLNLSAEELAASQSGHTYSCSLGAGWNLVGNPFADVAQLPPGEVGYWRDPSNAGYEVRSDVPLGGAVWIYSSTVSAVTLTAA